MGLIVDLSNPYAQPDVSFVARLTQLLYCCALLYSSTAVACSISPCFDK